MTVKPSPKHILNSMLTFFALTAVSGCPAPMFWVITVSEPVDITISIVETMVR